MDRIDSESEGRFAAFLPLDQLEREFGALPPSPRDAGHVVLLVRRGERGRRETPSRVPVAPDTGLTGDAWARQRRPDVDAQLAVMQASVATLIANGQPLALFGDNMFLDLDLSAGNLPARTQLRTGGGVLLEVTPLPHTGCRKFRGRFGDAALRFISRPNLRHLNLRGVYMRVVEGGELTVGDRVEVVSRSVTAVRAG